MMRTQTTMVVLANSIKMHGACVAGPAAMGGVGSADWVRPVADRSGGPLPIFRTMCSDGRLAQVLDVVSIPLGEAVPMLHQQENRMLEDGLWGRRDRLGWNQLDCFADCSGSPLWIDGYSSSCGLNDRVPEAVLPRIDDSLRMLHCEDVNVHRTTDCFGRSRLRASFVHGFRRYDLAVTDPLVPYMLDREASREWREAFLSVSLGMTFHGYAYKLVAAFITPERAGEPS